jgi:hypothetical protein
MATKNTAVKNSSIKTAPVKSASIKTIKSAAAKSSAKSAAAKTNGLKGTPLKPASTLKVPEKIEHVYSHPTMCLHCHLIVEMFHERGADPVKGAWQCPRCNHKYLFSHWKIKRQARGKTEAA